MSMLDQISVLILTYNEEPNIGRTLTALSRFTDIVVLDSGSTDRTEEVIDGFANTRLFTRRFDDHYTQWNYGLTNCDITRPWILALDADYVLPGELVNEIATLQPLEDQAGFRASFHYCIFGQQLSGTLYPAHVVLFRRDRAEYIQEGHTQRVIVDGAIGALTGRIDHDDRKPLARWLSSQQRYAYLEAEYLLTCPPAKVRFADRIRLTGILGPFFVFFYSLIVKRCLLDGWPGWFYVLQRTIAETMIALEIVNRRLSSNIK